MKRIMSFIFHQYYITSTVLVLNCLYFLISLQNLTGKNEEKRFCKIKIWHHKNDFFLRAAYIACIARKYKIFKCYGFLIYDFVSFFIITK